MTKAGAALEMIVRARLSGPLRGGFIGGIFFYKLKPNGQDHDEADFELLSNYRGKVGTNVYGNEPLGSGRFNFAALPAGLDVTAWHTYRILLSQTRDEWFIDGKLVRTETLNVPQGPVQAHFNIWAPAADFSQAYSARNKPSARPGANRDFHLFLDSVRIRRISLLTL